MNPPNPDGATCSSGATASFNPSDTMSILAQMSERFARRNFYVANLAAVLLIAHFIVSINEQNESQARWKRTQSANGSSQSPRGCCESEGPVDGSHADRA